MSYIAKRKNRVLHIAEDKAEEYAKMGYTILNEDGEKIAEPSITTIEGANAEIDRLRKENANLKQMLEETKEKAEAHIEDEEIQGETVSTKKTARSAVKKE